MRLRRDQSTARSSKRVRIALEPANAIANRIIIVFYDDFIVHMTFRAPLPSSKCVSVTDHRMSMNNKTNANAIMKAFTIALCLCARPRDEVHMLDGNKNSREKKLCWRKATHRAHKPNRWMVAGPTSSCQLNAILHVIKAHKPPLLPQSRARACLHSQQCDEPDKNDVAVVAVHPRTHIRKGDAPSIDHTIDPSAMTCMSCILCKRLGTQC